jgi:2,3-bisphosphoglycerate-dependent phosphoglycerate mutase
MTVVYLVRHAHADWQPSDSRGLSPSGRDQAVALARDFEGLPIAAIYSSPSQRALETIGPLAGHLGIDPVVLSDLRERELAIVPAAEFETAVAQSWRKPEQASPGGESNVAAQERGLALVRQIVDRHPGQHVVLATHGALLALILNALDGRFGYDFWTTLEFPDVYAVTFRNDHLLAIRRAFERPRTG